MFINFSMASKYLAAFFVTLLLIALALIGLVTNAHSTSTGTITGNTYTFDCIDHVKYFVGPGMPTVKIDPTTKQPQSCNLS